MSDLADFLHAAISHEFLGGFDVFRGLCSMHACVHARMQISHGASTRSFNYAIFKQHAENQVSMTILNKRGLCRWTKKISGKCDLIYRDKYIPKLKKYSPP